MSHRTDFQHAVPDHAHRIDPSRLPVRFLAPDQGSDGGKRTVTVDTDQVVMARRLGTMAMKITLPLTSYRGIVIRIVPGLVEADDRMCVMLAHMDRSLDVPLFEATDDTDVIAEWRLWGSTLNLPLMIEGLDGHMVAAENRMGDVVVDRPRPRRRHSLLAARRPRFAARRRMGQRVMTPVVHRG